MSAKRRVVKLINSFVSLVVLIAVVCAGAYSAYALWDNQQVYEGARNIQIQMQELKPDISDPEVKPSFEELLKINPDVCAWITMDGTNIDFPVLQGETNLTYINKNVYGEFALAGSIFLDFRNSRDFSDPYNLLYGHHMAEGNMFGDLDLYEEEAFFRKNTTGVLITPDRIYDLETVALLVVNASQEGAFAVEENRKDPTDVIAYIKENALYTRDAMSKMSDGAQILALSTCSSDFTDARTILITVMIPHDQGS